MWVLCTPIDPGIAYYVTVLFLIFIYPFSFGILIEVAKDFFKKGDIREIIYKNLRSEWQWFLGILGYLSFVAPACIIFFPFCLYYFSFSCLLYI